MLQALTEIYSVRHVESQKVEILFAYKYKQNVWLPADTLLRVKAVLGLGFVITFPSIHHSYKVPLETPVELLCKTTTPPPLFVIVKLALAFPHGVVVIEIVLQKESLQETPK